MPVVTEDLTLYLAAEGHPSPQYAAVFAIQPSCSFFYTLSLHQQSLNILKPKDN